MARADIAITSSYQVSTQGLKDHFGMGEEDALRLIKQSAVLAQSTRDEAHESGKVETEKRLLIAGSVGPYRAYLADGLEYRGDYQRTADEFQTFHRPRVAALIEQGVDMLAIETTPIMPKIESVIALLQADFPGAIAWISCTLRDAEHLSDGTPMRDVLKLAMHSDQVVAFGINCVPMRLVTAALQNLKAVLEDMPSTSVDMPLLCYPNSGEIWDAETKTWIGTHPSSDRELATRAAYWQDAGARLIGGCCRTGPEDVAGMAKAVREG